MYSTSNKEYQELPRWELCDERGGDISERKISEVATESYRAGLVNDLPGLNAKLLLEGIVVVAHKARHNASTILGILLGRPQQLQPWLQHLEEVLHGAKADLESGTRTDLVGCCT